jgi:uncharacterized protein YjiS (DUF1127 family)
VKTACVIRGRKILTRSLQRYPPVRELSQLSDRELDDLGISRFHISSVARQAAVA